MPWLQGLRGQRLSLLSPPDYKTIHSRAEPSTNQHWNQDPSSAKTLTNQLRTGTGRSTPIPAKEHALHRRFWCFYKTVSKGKFSTPEMLIWRCLLHIRSLKMSGCRVSSSYQRGSTLSRKSNIVLRAGKGSRVMALDSFKLVDICKVAKVVHGNQTNNHCHRSDTWLSTLLPELYQQPPCSLPFLEHRHAHTHTHTLSH